MECPEVVGHIVHESLCIVHAFFSKRGVALEFAALAGSSVPSASHTKVFAYDNATQAVVLFNSAAADSSSLEPNCQRHI